MPAPSSSMSTQVTVTRSPGCTPVALARRRADRGGELRQRHVVAIRGAAVAVVELLVLAGDAQRLQPADEDARAQVQVVLVARPGVQEDQLHPTQRLRVRRDHLDRICLLYT